jgi:hypothetical protein
MVKKVILEITNEVSDCIQTELDDVIKASSIESLLKINDDMHKIITKYKDKITEYYNNKSWDRYKKISNEYEMIFTTPNTGSNISHYTPVSRSFFKMWEMLHDFREEFGIDEKKNLKVCMLCEGPGGFAEALIKYRDQPGYNDEYHGISLKSDNNKNIPDWKLTNNQYLEKIHINYGSDGTGNIYNLSNIIHFAEHVGKKSVDFITADGGFDFSSDFNHQEEMSMQLIFSEILATLLIQKDGGSFVLKIYDMFTPNSLKIIHLLKRFYHRIFIVKPLTSRPANSEKYLVCTGFKRCDDQKKYLEMIYRLVIYKNEIPEELNIDYDIDTLRNIVLYNVYYTMRQMYYIQRTIDYINIFKNNNTFNSNNQDAQSSRRMMNIILEEHKRKSMKWCHKYNISC